MLSLPTTKILKPQMASLVKSSVKIYTIWVLPTGKESPGLALLDVSETKPELSVAEGTVQVTTAAVTPNGTVREMSLGQFWIMGSVLSVGWNGALSMDSIS